MENITLLMVSVIGLYVLFKAATSVLELGLKIAIGFLILSFLGYSFASWDEISAPAVPELMMEVNATVGYAAQQPVDTVAAPEETAENLNLYKQQLR